MRLCGSLSRRVARVAVLRTWVSTLDPVPAVPSLVRGCSSGACVPLYSCCSLRTFVSSALGCSSLSFPRRAFVVQHICSAVPRTIVGHFATVGQFLVADCHLYFPVLANASRSSTNCSPQILWSFICSSNLFSVNVVPSAVFFLQVFHFGCALSAVHPASLSPWYCGRISSLCPQVFFSVSCCLSTVMPRAPGVNISLFSSASRSCE